MLRLLGPLEISSGCREHDLGGSRQRVVLAMLALNANRVVPVEQLIDAVWNTAPPTTARAQIQICVSALRKIFTDAGVALSIRTRSPGYQLEAPPTDLDTEQFAALVATARAHVGAGRNSEAVADPAQRARDCGAGPRSPACAATSSAAAPTSSSTPGWPPSSNASGSTSRSASHEEVVGELAALVEEHPLRERLYEFLMLALYRSGRQAEALEVCRRARTILVEELGIEPGESLQRAGDGDPATGPRARRQVDGPGLGQRARRRPLRPVKHTVVAPQAARQHRRLHRPPRTARRDPRGALRRHRPGRPVRHADRRHLRQGRGRQVHPRRPRGARAARRLPRRPPLRRPAGAPRHGPGAAPSSTGSCAPSASTARPSPRTSRRRRTCTAAGSPTSGCWWCSTARRARTRSCRCCPPGRAAR